MSYPVAACRGKGGAVGFDPSSLPGPLALWKMDEGSGFALTNAFAAAHTPVNLCHAPEQIFGSGRWSTPGGSAWTDAYAVNPNGDNTASRLQLSGAGQSYTYCSGLALLAATTYTVSMYIKSNTAGSQTFTIWRDDTNARSALQTATTSWTRFTLTFTTVGAVSILAIMNDAGNTASDLLVWGFQVERGSSATAYQSPTLDCFFPTQSGGHPDWTARGVSCPDSARYGIAIRKLPTTTTAMSAYAAIKQTAAGADASYNWIQSDFVSYPNYFFGASGSNGIFQAGAGGPAIPHTGASSYAEELTPLNDGQWHVVACVYDGELGFVYFDGTLIGVLDRGVLSWSSSAFYVLGFHGILGMIGEHGCQAIYSQSHSNAQVRQMTAWMTALLKGRGATFPTYTRLVAYEGDSITAGYLAGGQEFPVVIHPNLPAQTLDARFALSGSSVSGVAFNTVLNLRGPYVDQALSPTRAKSVLCVLIGANDAGQGGNSTWVASLKTYCQARQAAGWKVVLCTILPQSGSGFNAKRNACNTLIRADPSFYDALADFAADPTMGPDAAGSNATYYSDGVHPTAAGHAILGPIAQTAIAGLL